MKNTQTETPNKDALIDYIQRLTPVQCEKVLERLPLLKKVCGKVKA